PRRLEPEAPHRAAVQEGALHRRGRARPLRVRDLDVLLRHEPVLLAEAMELLAVRAGGLYGDGTVGLGGHAGGVGARGGPGRRLGAFDRDAEALAQAARRLAAFGGRVRFEHADFGEVPERMAGERPDGVLVDLGVSSMQLDLPERGFSFSAEGPLDMRMDRSQG